MRCLLLHAEDDPIAGGLAGKRWDRVVDLGIAGPSTYKRWREVLGCAIEPYPSLSGPDFKKLRELHAFGRGQVVDEHGLDWWELACLLWSDQFVDLVLTVKLAESLDRGEEIWVTAERYATLLDAISPGRVRRIRLKGGIRHRSLLGRLRKLKFRQFLEILGDKYDGDYRWRRLVAPPTANCRRPVVLLPSAYGNASRTAVALAASLPAQDFLLVATRRSGWIQPVPQNTKRVWLSSYARANPGQRELKSLLRRWEELRCALREHPELAVLCRTGLFDAFPFHLQQGLAVRNSWANVLDSEPVVSVLCADEKNPYTRIPMLLAQRRGIPAVTCHHGALDGRYVFSDIAADQFLAKSEMEWNYLVRTCGMPVEKVRFRSGLDTSSRGSNNRKNGNTVVFFSEPYEALSCRACGIYGEVLPALARIARGRDRDLVIKLHPFESLRDRKQLVGRLLTREDYAAVRFVTGPITNELVDTAWFSMTVSSSAAVDCAARGVPAFLCLWLDRYGFGYGEQFVKFGAAMPLRAAEDIAAIPNLLDGHEGVGADRFSLNVAPELLRELLFPNTVASTAVGEKQTERLWA